MTTVWTLAAIWFGLALFASLCSAYQLDCVGAQHFGVFCRLEGLPADRHPHIPN